MKGDDKNKYNNTKAWEKSKPHWQGELPFSIGVKGGENTSKTWWRNLKFYYGVGINAKGRYCWKKLALMSNKQQ